MSRLMMTGVQLPPDSTGRITGAFQIDVRNDSGVVQSINVPATFIADANGVEIGSDILQALEQIVEHLAAIRESSELSAKILGG